MYIVMVLSFALFVLFGLKVEYEEDIFSLMPESSVESQLAFGSIGLKDKVYIQVERGVPQSESVDSESEIQRSVELVDEFMERFGEYAGTDDEGQAHLYVPNVMFVNNGEVVGVHVGLLDEGNDPDNPLTDEQRERLYESYLDGFGLLAAQDA